MLPKDLPRSKFIGILQLYKEIIGGGFVDDLIKRPDTWLEDVRLNKAYDGFRIGSNWTLHTKLQFYTEYPSEDLVVGANPNMDKDSYGYKELEEACDKFVEKASALLSD